LQITKKKNYKKKENNSKIPISSNLNIGRDREWLEREHLVVAQRTCVGVWLPKGEEDGRANVLYLILYFLVKFKVFFFFFLNTEILLIQ